MARALLIFLDGVGVGPSDRARNPFLQARLPTLQELLGGIPTLDHPAPGTSAGWARGLDATLGVEGTPQSGTGQTALLTGRNAPRIYGRHFGPWTPVSLRPLLERENVLSRAGAAGLDVAFANAYPRGFQESRWFRRPAAPPLAARAAGALTRHLEDLRDGNAVASDIVTDPLRSRFPGAGIPAVSARQAGRTLAEIAGAQHLTLFAHYGTDYAGHRADPTSAVEALERVDEFLLGVLEGAASDLLVLIASDHGNIEELGSRHTRNPALFIAAGPAVAAFPAPMVSPSSLQGVARALLRILGIEVSAAPEP